MTGTVSILGLETTVSIGKQANFTKPTTLARQMLNVYSVAGGATAQDGDDNILGATLNNFEDPVAPADGLDDHRVTVEVPLCIAQFGYWLAAYFGAETASGSASDYSHLWNSGALPPIIFLEHKLTTGKYRQHHGMVGESMEIDLSADREGFAKAKFTFVGLTEDPASAALTGVVTAAPTLNRPAQKLVNITYNAVAGGDLVGGKFTHKRTLKRVRGADGTGVPYAVEREAITQVTGDLSTRFHDDTFYDDARNKTARALGIYLLSTALRGIKFDFANARLSRMPVDVGDPSALEYNPSLRAWQDPTNPALVAKVLNSAATVVLP